MMMDMENTTSARKNDDEPVANEDKAKPVSIEEVVEKNTSRALESKRSGNEWCAKQSFQRAIECYNEAILVMDDRTSEDVYQKSVCYSNRAACHIMTNDWKNAFDDCSACLALLSFTVTPSAAPHETIQLGQGSGGGGDAATSADSNTANNGASSKSATSAADKDKAATAAAAAAAAADKTPAEPAPPHRREYSAAERGIIIKTLVRRSKAGENLDQLQNAVDDTREITVLDPSNSEARMQLGRLQALRQQQMEKQKAEMLGKLKELGNGILGKFGLSLDNFKSVKDPKTGSYSISFSK